MEKIEYIKKSGEVVASILKELKRQIKPGISRKYLDKTACDLMAEKGVYSSSLGYRGFPASICVSLNSELTHGIPDERIFQEGDIISLDIACYHKDEEGLTYH